MFDPASLAIGGAGMLLSTIVPMITGAIAENETRGDREKGQQALQKAIDEIMTIGAPPDMARAIILKEFKNAGVYTPKLEEAVTQSTSKVAEMQERDPSLREAQKSALSAYQELGRTGLSAEDRLALRTAQQQAETANRGRLESIKQSMAQRGMGGGGAELAAQLASAQSANEALSMSADRQAAQAQQARLGALAQMSGLGGQMRSQDWGQDTQRAQAADELERFNTLQRSGVQQRNIASQNQGSLYNLQQQQRIMDANTSQANEEARRQRAGEFQTWSALGQRAQARSGAQKDAASGYYQQAAQKAQNITGVGSGIAGIAGSLGSTGMQMYDKAADRELYAKRYGLHKAVPKTDETASEYQDMLVPGYNSR